MFPVRDDIPRDRQPWLAIALGLLGLVLAIVLVVLGEGVASALLVALDAVFAWIYGAGVLTRAGRVWFVVGALFGAAGGAAVGLAAGAEALGPVAAAAATGAALELVVLQLLRAPGTKIASLVLVPWFAGAALVPAPVWAAVWAALAVVLGLAGAFGG